MSSRLTISNQNKFKVSPDLYKPNFNQTERNIVKKFTFGYGNKLKIT